MEKELTLTVDPAGVMSLALEYVTEARYFLTDDFDDDKALSSLTTGVHLLAGLTTKKEPANAHIDINAELSLGRRSETEELINAIILHLTEALDGFDHEDENKALDFFVKAKCDANKLILKGE